MLLFFPGIALSTDVSLAWDHSTSTGVTGYKVYYGTSSRSYVAPVIVPYQNFATVTGLPSGTYYFAVTAFDASGNESAYSTEISTTIAGYNKCDLNQDGSVNSLDLQLMINSIVNKTSIGDVNNSGISDIIDLQILINKLIGYKECP